MTKRGAPVGIGLASLFTVLLVLVLAVFSALTLTTARADLALSRINAETAKAYYAADAQAVERYRAFAAGTGAELDEMIPMTQTQALHIHAVRNEDGIKLLAWQTVPVDEGESLEEENLPVWGG